MAWRQFQANAASQGFTLASTGPASQKKWQLEVGPVSFASPVIGPTGVVYIGTLTGELVAISPNGQVRWRKMLGRRGSFIAGSAAVDEAGNIYAISTFRAIKRDHTGGNVVTTRIVHSILHSLAPDGSVRWTHLFPANDEIYKTDGYCLSSPKISRGPTQLLFMPSIVSGVSPSSWAQVGLAIEILVIGLDGRLVHRSKLLEHGPGPVTTTGGGVGSIFGTIWDFLNGANFNPSGAPNLFAQFGQPEPNIALADFGRLVNAPVVVLDDNYLELQAYRWENQGLTQLWKKRSPAWRRGAAPAVFASQMVASGQKNGKLELYDLTTGSALWQPWLKAAVAIQSPAASFVSQIYVVAGNKLIALDANGQKLSEFDMGSEALGAPALSTDRVFVSSRDGLHSLSLDLKQSIHHDLPGGVSSPVIADDGTVYVMDRNKTLHSFGNPALKPIRSVKLQFNKR